MPTVLEWIGIGFLIFSTGILADVFLIERLFIKTKRFYIQPATNKSNNIKIVQISDLHIRSINYQLARLIKKVNKLQPDLIIITGDAIDDEVNIGLLNDFLQRIDKNIQKAAILGNWEYQGKVNLIELKSVYANNNCTLLINQSIQYPFQGKTILITGLDDYLCGKPDFKTAISKYHKSDYHIILAHCPKYSDQLSKQIAPDSNVDFILSGHTHGGQITLFGYVLYTPRGSGRYVKGWYKDRSPILYVSKGIGTVSIPVRFGARPEFTVFYLAK